uniref:Uncharacterized protein n=1 Tax=Rhizophora mucronata TaxID=61149 RepID=A0A2P2IRY5_RHIMU
MSNFFQPTALIVLFNFLLRSKSNSATNLRSSSHLPKPLLRTSS